MPVEAESNLILLFLKELNRVGIKVDKFSRKSQPVILLDATFKEMVMDSNL